MTPATAEIAVIVVNYGTADLTIEAVESVLERGHGGRRVEIHVVDNASPGDDASRLVEAHGPRGWGEAVTLHLETENHGFGRGNNVVLETLARRDRPPEKVFLLNPDARLGNESLEILARVMDETPRAAAVGASLLESEGAPMSSAFKFPSVMSEIERSANFGPISRLLAGFRIPLPPDLPRQKVDWVSGAAVMFRFKAIHDVGFFDPAYFLYYEEVDLMLALQRKGWETWFVPEARVVHIGGASTGVGDGHVRRRRPPYLYASWKHYFLKNHGRAYALMAATLALAGGGIHVAASRLRGREPWLPLNYFGDFSKQVLRPLVRGGDRTTVEEDP